MRFGLPGDLRFRLLGIVVNWLSLHPIGLSRPWGRWNLSNILFEPWIALALLITVYIFALTNFSPNSIVPSVHFMFTLSVDTIARLWAFMSGALRPGFVLTEILSH